jgi:hypothetical protein
MGDNERRKQPLSERIKERLRDLVDDLVGSLEGLLVPQPDPIPVRPQGRTR